MILWIKVTKEDNAMPIQFGNIQGNMQIDGDIMDQSHKTTDQSSHTVTLSIEGAVLSDNVNALDRGKFREF